MKWIRVWAIARKEFTHIIRDPRSLGMAIAIPMLLLVLFGSALTLDVDNVPLVIWDQSQSPASRALVSRFAASRYFSIRAQVRNYPQIERAIDVRTALMALIIPTDFARRVASGREAPVQAIVDAVKVTLDRTPPELSSDLMEQGIVLTGGGALLAGIAARLEYETNMPIIVANDPLNCVALGSGMCLEELDVFARMLKTSPTR